MDEFYFSIVMFLAFGLNTQQTQKIGTKLKLSDLSSKYEKRRRKVPLKNVKSKFQVELTFFQTQGFFIKLKVRIFCSLGLPKTR